jgi:uroporphyrinogen III methyltransferase/synthase
MQSLGKVYLVGAGPGDPGLLTLRGRDCLARADVVVYDALAHPALLEHAPGAERIFVGKQAGRHSLPQEDIHRVLIAKARAGAMVVRLKGGDPFVFGRGGEEALALAEAGIPFEVVPGVSAGIGAPAYAGIPVTHRGLTTSVTFITAHPRGEEPHELGLARLATEGTLVFFMGVTNLPAAIDELRALGRDGATPAAIIEWGTYARQRTISGTLDTIAARAVEAVIEAPALVVVGEVAALREDLAWFEARPLHGLRVAVTHTRQRQGYLEQRLIELGADVLPFPTLAIEPVGPPGIPLHVTDFDYIVLTSVNAVEMLLDMLARAGRDARALAGARLCVPGTPAVAEALRARCLEPDVLPKGYGADAVITALEEDGGVAGKRILLPRADIARGSIPEALRAAGAEVTEVVAWHSAPPKNAESNISTLAAFEPHLIVFTSAGAVAHFSAMLGEARLTAIRAHAAFASLGPVTTGALREHGIAVAIEPSQSELPHLLEAICAWRANS